MPTGNDKPDPNMKRCVCRGEWRVAGNANTATMLPPLLVSRREAARLLGVSPGTIDNLRIRHELPSVRVGTRRLFDVADLRQLIAARKGATR